MVCLLPSLAPCDPSHRAPAFRTAAGLGFAALLLIASASAQEAKAPKETIIDGYAVHQSIDLGGRIASYSGSRPMYDTLVNMQSGPRVLTQSLDMHAVAKARYPFFDRLTTSSAGYGGDPNDFTMLRMSKGKIYDFQGIFRRDRQYFDYNLLDNPLVPAGLTSNGYTFPQVQSTPHLFNTVRRMTDVNLTLAPLSKVSFRAGYSQNINQGPTYSSVHFGIEAQLLQNWRNSTDVWLGAVDWKPFTRTLLTYAEHIVHYKGNTNWQLAGANLQLANGAPVSLGFDNVTVPACTGAAIMSNSTSPPTANPTCNGYLQYSRVAPIRTLVPTEEFTFQSSDIKNVQMNGHFSYTGASMTMPNYVEFFNGEQTRTKLRQSTVTGYGKAERVNVSGDFGAVWEVSRKFSLSEQYDLWYFRQPSSGYLSEVDQSGTSMVVAPGAALAPVITTADNFLGMKTVTNTVVASWDPSSRAGVSIGYRYRLRSIDLAYDEPHSVLDIHENGGLMGAVLRPTLKWRINGNVEVAYADKAYTRISPRQLQHYKVRTTYKPRDWATISGTYNDLERRDNVYLVNHLDHNRSATFGASLMPNEHYGVELNYGYLDVFSQSTLCFADTPAPAGAAQVPAGTGCGTNIYLGSGYYDAPTEYGSIGITLAPVKNFRSTLGYRMSAANGKTEFLNPRQVPGSLQSQYQTPYGSAAWTIASGWAVRAEWNYYSYGEGTPIGPTLPRSFRGNLYTFSMHHEF